MGPLLPSRLKTPTSFELMVRSILSHARSGYPTQATRMPLLARSCAEYLNKEAFFTLLVLKRDHCLLNIVIVGFQLAFQICSLVIEAAEGLLDPFKLFLALNPAPMFGTNVHSNGVE